MFCFVFFFQLCFLFALYVFFFSFPVSFFLNLLIFWVKFSESCADLEVIYMLILFLVIILEIILLTLSTFEVNWYHNLHPNNSWMLEECFSIFSVHMNHLGSVKMQIPIKCEVSLAFCISKLPSDAIPRRNTTLEYFNYPPLVWHAIVVWDFVFFFLYLFIYLFALGLGCSKWGP